MVDVTDCISVEQDTARLACFDRAAAQRTAAKRTVIAAQPSETVSNAETEDTVTREISQTPTKTSKLPPKRTPRQEQAQFEVKATIVEAKKVARGKWHLKLDNGQAWLETEPGRNRYKVGETIRIESSFLGSYSLFAQGKRARKFRPIY